MRCVTGTHRFCLYHLIVSEFETTETELNAIIEPAIMGFNRNPVMGW